MRASNRVLAWPASARRPRWNQHYRMGGVPTPEPIPTIPGSPAPPQPDNVPPEIDDPPPPEMPPPSPVREPPVPPQATLMCRA